MRQDQFATLQTRIEQLVDVAMVETDPDTWPGAGVASKDMTQADRGDRFWCKKNAAATLSLAQRMATLVQIVREKTAGADPLAPEAVTAGEADLDREIASANHQAERLLKTAMDKAAGRRGKP